VSTTTRDKMSRTSSLLERIQDGLGAVENADRALIDGAIRASFDDSLDLDEAMRPAFPNENRWDYLLGHASSGAVVALEPHSANTSEASVVIAKRRRALDQLRGHFEDGHRVTSWYWVASGKVDFAPHDKIVNQLNQNGITFVGRALLQKHLPSADIGQAPTAAGKKKKKKR
jgi:hypothetical protein